MKPAEELARELCERWHFKELPLAVVRAELTAAIEADRREVVAGQLDLIRAQGAALEEAERCLAYAECAECGLEYRKDPGDCLMATHLEGREAMEVARAVRLRCKAEELRR